MDFRYNIAGYTSIFDDADTATRASGLPGHHNGPADAFRHIVASAEAARRYGEFPASLLGQLNEVKGDVVNTQPKDERDMDLANNLIGIRIGLSAGSFEEIVEKAKAVISDATTHGGTGSGGTAQWLPEDRWRNDTPLPDPASAGPTAESKASAAERALALPVESWTQDDVHAVQRSKIYLRGDGRDRTVAFGKVRRWYETQVARERNADRSKSGSVVVSAYVRSDGTKVASHSRHAPR